MSATTHPYTCNTCQVAFKGSDLQRGHMQSDWHRYNLKRRVASLPPLTSEIFNEKVLATQATAAASAAKASFEKVCGACQRTYFSENAYTNHLNSQKHRAMVAQLAGTGPEDFETNSMMSSAFSLGESMELKSADRESVASRDTDDDNDDDDAAAEAIATALRKTQLTKDNIQAVDSDASDDQDDASTTDGKDEVDIIQKCLFCNHKADSPATNVAHMRTVHGMFIPEAAYLVDLPGLLEYLYTRVAGMHECLYCGTVKYTTPGIQTHMRDKGHCMIAFESEEQMIEVGQFYDFSSTYSDSEEADDESDDSDDGAARGGGVKLGSKRAARYTNDDGEEEEGSDWESDEDEDEDMKDVDKDAKAGPTPSLSRAHRKPRLADSKPIYHDEFELHLPSGRSVGHRSLARYYRQNLHNYPVTPEERAARLAIRNDSDNEDTRGPARGRAARAEAALIRANGGLGMLGVTAQKKAELRATHWKQVKNARRAENQIRARVEKRQNNQKHFRDPLLQ